MTYNEAASEILHLFKQKDDLYVFIYIYKRSNTRHK